MRADAWAMCRAHSWPIRKAAPLPCVDVKEKRWRQREDSSPLAEIGSCVSKKWSATEAPHRFLTVASASKCLSEKSELQTKPKPPSHLACVEQLFAQRRICPQDINMSSTERTHQSMRLHGCIHPVP